LIGILQMARNSMMAAWSSDIYAARYWQAGGAPTTVLTTEQELIGTQAEELGNRWRDRRSKGPDFPAVLGKGAKAVPWGADISNAVATDARREIALEIANLFGVNGRYINITPSGQSQSYSNVQDEALNLERFTLASFIDPIQDVVSDLLPEDRNMLIDTTRLTRAGQESRFRAWQIATGNKAWMMPEEVRQEEGLGPSDEIQAFQDAAVEGAKASADAMAEGPQPPIAKPQEKVPVDA
jgi:phage portal protein BeeE